MQQLPWIGADDVAASAPIPMAIEALRTAFASRPEHIERTSHPVAGGELLVMPATGEHTAGIKLLMIQPRNASRGQPVIQGTYVLFDATAGRPVALLDGAALTAVRTPAVSAVATDALARAGCSSLGIVGSGPQAIAHAEAVRCVRPTIDSIVFASRTPANAAGAARTAGALAGFVGCSVRAGTHAEAAAADIVCTATRATEPFLHRTMVRPGTHINAVGAYRPDMGELASDLVAGSTVVVDELHAAQHEAGDLIRASESATWSWDDVAGELADVCGGRIARRTADEITVFKSVGLAFEDLVIAQLVAARRNLV